MIRLFITVIRTLTIIPIPGKDATTFSNTLPVFPLIGVLLGGIVFGVYSLFEFVFPGSSILIAISLVATGVIVTGALHLDGFGDVADGFGGGGNSKERIMAIFKDSRLGTFGVTALIFDLGTKTMVYSYFVEQQTLGPIGISVIVSRSMQALAMAFIPYARNEGTAAPFSCSPPKLLTVVSVILHLILCTVIVPYAKAIPAIGIASILCFLFAVHCIKKIGGITGDCIGGINEIAELSVLLVIYSVTCHFG
jgi:adenosylcobinamide-GDP ribazoletransferase